MKKTNYFFDRILPESGYLVGNAMLINYIEENANDGIVLPEVISICTDKNKRYVENNIQVFTVRHLPDDNLFSHLQFAIKYEPFDLLILKKFFELYDPKLLKANIIAEPTGKYNRKIWFLYEWLLNETLDIIDLKQGNYVDLLDDKIQYTSKSIKESRYRINNNLPGVPDFCPLIRKTEKLEKFIAENFSDKITEGLNDIEKDILRRTSAFLLLKDSKASFAIEGENPPNIRARNWGKIIGEAGKYPLSVSEIERLQAVVIGSKKLKEMGIRKSEGFIGVHDRETFEPIPDHISAKASDLDKLLSGLFSTEKLLFSSNYNAVLTSASIAFGFVFIHPLIDGNGRIHRYILHHILTEKGFTNSNIIFPLSSAILNKIDDYRNVLENFSANRVDLIKWEQTDSHNVEIENNTIDLYRYFDATPQAEFVFECVKDTIEEIIPAEIEYLHKYDLLFQYITTIVSLSDSMVDLLIKYIIQNKGKLSNKKRKKDFDELSDSEILKIEEYYSSII